jgi:hypothetical protein
VSASGLLSINWPPSSIFGFVRNDAHGLLIEVQGPRKDWMNFTLGCLDSNLLWRASTAPFDHPQGAESKSVHHPPQPA